MRTTLQSSLALTACVIALFCAHDTRAQIATALPYRADARALAFTPNLGQVADMDGHVRPDILYTGDFGGARIFVRRTGISYVFTRVEGDVMSIAHGRHDVAESARDAATLIGQRVDMELVGSLSPVRVVESGVTEGHTNYYYAHCPNGIVGVRSYRRLELKEVYPGIDMILRGTDSGMKCDFVVHPGARLSDIRFRFAGEDSVDISPSGELVVTNPLAIVREEAPFSFQIMEGLAKAEEKRGGERRVNIRYVRLDDGTIGLEATSRLDNRATLVVDPGRSWATFYGGSGVEMVNTSEAMDIDDDGDLLFAGGTDNGTFPITAGAFQTLYAGSTDGVIVRLREDGTRLWATYYGGTAADLPHGVKVDSSRRVWITGHSDGGSFPVSAGCHQPNFGGVRDAIVLLFDSLGTRLWATFVGGTAFDDGFAIAIDSAGDATVIGCTASLAGISTTGAYQTAKAGGDDAFLMKFSPTGARIAGTYFGGTLNEWGTGADIDAHDEIVFTGYTNSINFPVRAGYQSSIFQSTLGGAYDAFVVRFHWSRGLIWSTYMGGSQNENQDGTRGAFCGVGLDTSGNVLLSGYTSSSNFPTRSAYQATYAGGRDVFLAKFDSTGNLLWSSFFGGSSDEAVQGLTVLPWGSVVVTGHTASTNFPAISSDAFAASKAGAGDAFVFQLSSDGTTVEYGTYYGGSNNDEGTTVRSYHNGTYAICGITWSANFPVTSNAFQRTCGSCASKADAFFIRFACNTGPGHLDIDSSGRLSICQWRNVALSVRDTTYARYLWSTGSEGRTLSVDASGVYYAIAVSPAGCISYSDTFLVIVNSPIADPLVTPSGTRTLCAGDSVALQVFPAIYSRYFWYDSTLTTRLVTDSLSSRFVARQPGTMRAIVQDFNGCFDTSNAVAILVNPRPDTLSIWPRDTVRLCQGDSITLTASRARTSTESFQWIGAQGQSGATIVVKTAGVYQLRALNGVGCEQLSNRVVVQVRKRSIPPITPTPSTTVCEGDTIVLKSATGFIRYRWSNGDTTMSTRVWRSGTYTLETIDSNDCISLVGIDVTVIPTPVPRITASGPTTLCTGDSVTLEVVGDYSLYEWSTGAQTKRITVKSPGAYTVRVFNTTSWCVGASPDTVRVTVQSAPDATISGPVGVCRDAIVTYSVVGRAGMSYTWQVSGGGGMVLSGDGTSAISVQWGGAVGNGTVRVTLRDLATGCTRDTSITVQIGLRLVPSIISSRSTNLCPGDTVVLDAGGGYTSYEWVDGAGGTRGTGRSIVVRDSGRFVVRVVQGSCSGESFPVDVRLVDLPAPQIAVVAGDTMLCAGSSATLDAGAYQAWRWLPLGQTTRQIVVRDTGSYSVEVTDSNGCAAVSSPVRVTVEQATRPPVNGMTSVCVGADAQYTTPPAAGASFKWTLTGTAGTVLSSDTTSSVMVRWSSAGFGSLILQRTLASGCRGVSNPLLVSVGTSLEPDVVVGGANPFCDGDSVVLRAPSGLDSYVWSDSLGTELGRADTLVVTGAGRYRVTVVGGACSGEAEVDVARHEVVLPTVDPAGPITLCDGDSVVLSASPGYADYLWSSGDRGPSTVVSRSGQYGVRVIDANGCVGISAVVDVQVNPALNVAIVRVGDTLSIPGGYTQQWFVDGTPVQGATDSSYLAIRTGRYHVDLIDSNGCPGRTPAVDVVIDHSVVATADVKVGQYSGSPGSRITIPVEMPSTTNFDAAGIQTYALVLRVDRSILVPVTPGVTSTFVGNDRLVTVHGDVPPAFDGGAPLTAVDFLVALGDRRVSPIAIDTISFGEGPVVVNTEDGQFTLQDVCENGGTRLIATGGETALRSVHPNPSSGLTDVEYEVAETGTVRIDIVDALGRAIQVLFAPVSAGRYVVTIDMSMLPAGPYLCVLTTRSEMKSLLMRIVR